MFSIRIVSVATLLFCLLTAGAGAAEPDKTVPPSAAKPAEPVPAESVERLVEQVRKSLAVISFTGRDGQRQGLGSGFIISPDGLVATNFHVLGEGRPISVQLADGKQFDISGVHASDRTLDLAILRIDAHDLSPLPLGNSDELRQGQSVVALGSPQGLKNSVVGGIVSGLREVEGRSMIQLAIPIEAGNSGGPLVDMQGRVQGILTLKSAITPNLGFALAVNQLKPLVEKPNPIPLSRWLTIGALNPRDWKPMFGAHWHRRAGHIIGEGVGDGFGGRTLCLYQQPLPELPYEVAVTVRLGDESGAAGLAFCSDGDERHYGFYPTAGKLRLTRFDGPDLFSWKVLHDQPNPNYQPGDWNTLRVRLETGKLQAYVNDHLVVEWADAGLQPGKVGLAKFRETQADFKSFRVGRELKTASAAEADVARVAGLVDKISTKGWPQADLVSGLSNNPSANIAVLRDRARSLEQQAAQLRQLGQAVHCREITAELVKALAGKEGETDLFYAALLLSKLDNEEVDVELYRQELARMAGEIAAGFPKDAGEDVKLSALQKYLFEENGFHGSRHDYYNRANSYLNEVLDDREGLPITLSVLYMELARQLGLNVVGIGLPGHFVVQYVPPTGEARLIDVYEGAKPLAREEAARTVRENADRELTDQDLAPTSKRAIIARMLHNLLGAATEARDLPAMVRYLDAIVAIDPEAGSDRWLRARVSVMVDRRDTAQEDVAWLLEHKPPTVDPDLVRELERLLAASAATPPPAKQAN